MDAGWFEVVAVESPGVVQTLQCGTGRRVAPAGVRVVACLVMDEGANLTALDRTLESLGLSGPRDAAQVQMLRSLAAAVDKYPSRAALWEQYRAGLKDLLRDSGADDEIAKLLAEINGGAPVGDASPS